MGNLLSIHTEIFVKRGAAEQTLSPAEALYKLIAPMNGHSYNGYPMIAKESGTYEHFSIRISYGEKYVPRHLFRFFEENEPYIDKLFARTYYEGGDLDYIFSLPSTNKDFEAIKRACRYGFDEILFKPKENINLTNQAHETFGAYLSIKLNGDMHAVSCLIDVDDANITGFPIEHNGSLKTYAINAFSCSDENLLQEIMDKSADAIFKFKGKTVHQKIDAEAYNAKGYPKSPNEHLANSYNNGKYDIHSSGWRNCVDKEYLEYLKSIKREAGI